MSSCGFTANADYVAATNILAAGHAVLARGECGYRNASVKREPPSSGSLAPEGMVGLPPVENVNSLD